MINNAKKEVAQAEEGCQAEAAHLKEKVAEVMSLQEVLQKEGQTSADLKAALQEEIRKAEAEVSKLKEQIPTLVSEARAQAVEEFKASSEMRDLNIKFGQATLIKGFELCQEKVVRKFSELDLSFLGEASEDKAGPSPTATTTAAPLLGQPNSPTPISEV